MAIDIDLFDPFVQVETRLNKLRLSFVKDENTFQMGKY